MSTDLRTQIRTYGAQLVDSQTPITDMEIAKLQGKVRQLPPARTPVQPRPRLWVAVAAGVAVLVLFGGLSLLMARNGLDTPPATTPPTVTSVTTPATTTTLATENAAPATGMNTYQDLPNEASIGWQWHETGLNTGDWMWRLSSGTYIAYNLGFNSIWDQDDGPTLFSIDGSTERFADPAETMHISADGESWNEVPLFDRFDGFVAYPHVETRADLPYFYVTVRPTQADPDEAGSWSTWGTDDGMTWFEVLIDGDSVGIAFGDHTQIGDTVVIGGPRWGRDSVAGGMLVSTDGGRSFMTVKSLLPSFEGLAESYVYEDKFRILGWPVAPPQDDGFDVWIENPVVWESPDGVTWTEVGTSTGLEPQADGRGLVVSYSPRIEWLPNGYLLLSGAEPRSATFSKDPAAYVLESYDGGLTWTPVDNFPITAEPDFDSLVPAGHTSTVLDGWIVLNGEAILATNGKTWLRVDSPAGTQITPIALRGVVINNWEMSQIVLPND